MKKTANKKAWVQNTQAFLYLSPQLLHSLGELLTPCLNIYP